MAPATFPSSPEKNCYFESMSQVIVSHLSALEVELNASLTDLVNKSF